MARAGRPKKVLKKAPKNTDAIFEQMFNQSIKKLKANERDIEKAIKQVLTDDEIKVSEAEFNEIKKLTDTLDEIDSIFKDI